MPPYFFVFNVESIGLHGEGFAVGIVVIDSKGEEQEATRFSCPPRTAKGDDEGRIWVAKNYPLDAAPSHAHPEAVRDAFWHYWSYWKGCGAMMVADCGWPVEARFLAACVDQEPSRAWRGPYPLLDIGSILLARGLDPLACYPRLANELPEHDPLCDAWQSARILIESLGLGKGQGE
jgi:hypothetical protein